MTELSDSPWATQRYASYLLRLWKIGVGEQPSLRASVQNSRTGETVGFVTLDELFEYLQAEASLDSTRASV